MWLALCDAADRDGVWACEQLNESGFPPIELVTTQSLLVGSQWTLESQGSVTCSQLRIEGGRTIDSSEVEGVLNRIAVIPPLTQSNSEDGKYAAQEVSAFLLAWLASLSNVLNPPSPGGLCGQLRSMAEWTFLAARAGLRTLTYERRVTSARQPSPTLTVTDSLAAFVFGSEVLADRAAPGIKEGCRSLARLAGTPMLEVSFVKIGEANEDTWLFSGASPVPELCAAGHEGTRLLAAALLGNSATP